MDGSQNKSRECIDKDFYFHKSSEIAHAKTRSGRGSVLVISPPAIVCQVRGVTPESKIDLFFAT